MIRLIDLFCGAGGFSIGMEQAGFRTVQGVDLNPSAVGTFQNAHPDAHGCVAGVGDVLDDLLPAEVIIGGPPCPPFSQANNHKRLDDPRAGLWRDFIRAVERVEPDLWVMENVPQFKGTEGFDLIQGHCQGGNRGLWSDPELEFLDEYQVNWWILQAAYYGAPQKRSRLILSGNRKGVTLPRPPQRTPWVTLRDSILHLPSLVKEPEWPGVYSGEELHFDFTTVEEQTILSWVPPGVTRRHGKYKYHRPSWDEQAKTVLAQHTTFPGQAVFHPMENRRLTLFERARVQTFPDSMLWTGQNTGDVSTQIGNAVPPVLAQAVGEHFMKALF